jgi:outer membrane protein assembly factor BamB
MADTFDQRLEQDLDTWWDAVNTGLDPLTNSAPLLADIETARYVAARHKGLPPSPTFARVLKANLMQLADVPKGVSKLPPHIATRKGNISVSDRVLEAFWPRQRSRIRGLIELAAAAALVLVFLGTAFGDGPLGGLNSLWRQTDEQSANGYPVGMYRGNAARTGVATDPGPVGFPALKWKANIGPNSAVGGAVGAGGRVYLTNGDRGEVWAYDASTGDIYWRATVGQMWGTSPAVGNGLVYVVTAGPDGGGSDAGYLIALDAGSGSERWRYKTGGSGRSSPALDGDTIYVTAVDNTLRAVDSLTGQERWRFDYFDSSIASPGPGTPIADAERAAQTLASPAMADGVVYVTSGGDLIAVDARHGRELWRLETDGDAIFTPAIVGGSLYFSLVDSLLKWSSMWVVAVDATSGKERWRTEVISTPLSGPPVPAVADGLVFVGSLNNGFKALDATSGRTVWTFAIDDVTTDVTYSNGVMYGASSDDGRLYALDATTGTVLWQVDTAALIAREPVVVDGIVVLPSTGGEVDAIGGTQSGGTPVAVPGASVDVTGLPPCDPPRHVSVDQFSGTPTATLLLPVTHEFGGQPQIKPDEIPQGEFASGDAVGGILETLRGMAACSRPTDDAARQGYFTDDYFCRDWVRNYMSWNPGRSGAWLIWGADGNPATGINDARVLPDRRVGVVIMYSQKEGTYAIFAEQDGHWLVDERYEITGMLGARG